MSSPRPESPSELIEPALTVSFLLIPVTTRSILFAIVSARVFRCRIIRSQPCPHNQPYGIALNRFIHRLEHVIRAYTRRQDRCA